VKSNSEKSLQKNDSETGSEKKMTNQTGNRKDDDENKKKDNRKKIEL